MKVSLNQIRKDYNNSINEIPEEKLKKLFNKLYYEAYHAYFIEEDKKAHDKIVATIEGLIKNTEQPKLFKAGREAIIRQPVEVMIELYNKNKRETRELINELFKTYLTFVCGENDLLNCFIEIIDRIEEGKHSIQFLRNEMVKIRDTTTDLLEIHQKDMDRTIEYYESKEDLTELDIEGLKMLKANKRGAD